MHTVHRATISLLFQVVLKNDWRVETLQNGTQLSFLFRERYANLCLSLSQHVGFMLLSSLSGFMRMDIVCLFRSPVALRKAKTVLQEPGEALDMMV